MKDLSCLNGKTIESIEKFEGKQGIYSASYEFVVITFTDATVLKLSSSDAEEYSSHISVEIHETLSY